MNFGNWDVNNNLQSSFQGTVIFKAPEILNNEKYYVQLKMIYDI